MPEVVDVDPAIVIRDEWTFEDLEALDLLEWWRYEIVDGALVVSPSTAGIHELASADVRNIVWPALPDGYIVAGPMGVAMGRTYLVPDLVVVERAILRRKGVLQPADVLVVAEIVSPGSRSMDRVLKPAKYAEAGISHYWRVETDPVSVTTYELRDGVYAEIGSWGAGETARIAAPFPVEIKVDRLV